MDVMLPITFALRHKEMLQMLNDNLQVENEIISVRQNYSESESSKQVELTF